MSTIIITEKPSVAREYAKVMHIQQNGTTEGYIEGFSPILQTNTIITWAIGHLIGICTPEEHHAEWKTWRKETLPMFPEPFLYKPLSNVVKQFQVINHLYTRKDIDRIYYAGDSGREGIYIQALIRNQIFRQPPAFDERVVWIDSYTEESILNGIRNAKPYAEYQNMIESGYARAEDDWLIGMNLSRAFTLSFGQYGNSIAVGRVMTATLAMVVKRQEEIDAFRKTEYFGIKADNASWKALKGSRFYESPLLYNENGFLKESDAEALRQELERDKRLTVQNVKVQTKTQYAPYLFNLADLQAYCSKNFHISPADTLNYAQSLYEKKLTTYPRTDCRFLSTAVQKELYTKFGYAIPDRYVDDSKITDHYAIIPTFEGSVDSLSAMERKIYDAVYRRIMDTMEPPFIYDAISIRYIHTNGEYFVESYRLVKQAGFRKKIEEDDILDKPAPNVGDVIPVTAFLLHKMETKPPVPYTTGTLILAMEKAGKLIEDEELREQIKTCGIGTSATRAEIIEKLKHIQYITADRKQKIAPTEKGKFVVNRISQYDTTILSPEKTAEIEQSLHNIADGKLSHTAHVQAIKEYISALIQNIIEHPAECTMEEVCPNCGSLLTKNMYGWSCSEKCGMSVGKVFKHILTDEQVRALLHGQSVQIQSNGMETTVLPQIQPNEWNGKTYYNWVTQEKIEILPNACPKCGGDIKKGPYGWFCMNKCGMNVGQIFGTKIPDESIKKLVQGESVSCRTKTGIITILPEIAENVYNNKTYYNWKTGQQAEADKTEKETYQCPNCHAEAVKGAYGWYCKDRCGMNIGKVYKHQLTDTQVERLLQGTPVTFSEKGKKTTVLPAIVQSQKNGKTYYNWKTQQ